jgi:hypothetical protein
MAATTSICAASPFPVPKASLPLVIYRNYDAANNGYPTYIPSGYMGNVQGIKMTPNCANHPHSGSTCLMVQYLSSKDWGGVVWQSPANNWGNQPGGWNLTGAKHLTFWARGDKGG